MRPIIGLFTDFGIKSIYPGEMKAVILSINPDALIVDITHNAPRHDVSVGAFLLKSSVRYFPKGSIIVGVIDPGVGSARKPIVVKSKEKIYVGPDNGLLVPAAESEGIEAVYEITNKEILLSSISSTFHGRDIFAPVAAHISKGVPVESVGPKLKEYVRVKIPYPKILDDEILCKVMYVDEFGNVITNVNETLIDRLRMIPGKIYKISLGTGEVINVKFSRSYSEVPKGVPLILINSLGCLELAINMGNAASEYGLSIGSEIKIFLK